MLSLRHWLPTALLVFLFALSQSSSAATVSDDDLSARLRLARQLARETNKPELVEQVKQSENTVRKLLSRDDRVAADKTVREAEALTGIDPGGWSMHGLKIFHPTAEMQKKLETLRPQLDAAMQSDDAARVRTVVAEMKSAMGDQAGLPDARRNGRHATPHKITEAQAVDYFLAALQNDRKAVRDISAGKTVGKNMLRLYADIISAGCDIRAAIARQHPEQLAELDQLVSGACQVLLDHQQPDGHFPFPDLRGSNIRFGEMTEKLAEQGKAEIKDGWLLTVDPSGGSQFDTGVCGVALLTASQTYTNGAWRKAGLRAADWSLAQPCVANFNYNAFSVSLLCRAFAVTKASKYLDGAWHKYQVGVAPGQMANGCWIDAHNARTVYHHIILRALNDLATVLPTDRSAERREVEKSATLALQTLLDEFTAAGITVDLLSELLRYASWQTKPDTRLNGAISEATAVIVEKSVQGDRAKFGAPATELAALAHLP